MSRSKKSRKPGVGKRETVKEVSKKDIEPLPRKPKKKTGKQPGNRQQEAFAQKKQTQNNSASKDPRLGSKTPIDLTPKVVKTDNKPKKQKQTPIAAIRVIEPVESIETDVSALEQELYAIEEDAQLQTILVLQEDDEPLTEEQIDYFNQKMERHQQLREQLGWDDEDEEIDSDEATKSEDDLWDKLDTNDLSDYE
jgi:ribosome assembly protein YihI (activator of Der GTPase)